MLILEKNKSINFNVIGYEFPDEKSSKKDFNYDANWLRIEVVYCDENTNQTFTDTCLLTYELSDLVTALQQVIDGNANSYMADFMEPYLSVCITRVDDFIMFVFSFVYDTAGEQWSKIEVTTQWTMGEAKEKAKELQAMKLKFPQK